MLPSLLPSLLVLPFSNDNVNLHLHLHQLETTMHVLSSLWSTLHCAPTQDGKLPLCEGHALHHSPPCGEEQCGSEMDRVPRHSQLGWFARPARRPSSNGNPPLRPVRWSRLQLIWIRRCFAILRNVPPSKIFLTEPDWVKWDRISAHQVFTSHVEYRATTLGWTGRY